MAPPKKTAGEEIQILEVQQKRITVAVVGTSPFICNRVSEKAQRELVLPKGRKTAAEKSQSLKHSPLDEYRNSPYTLTDDNAPTLLAFLATAFKRAAMTAALDIPGAKKTQIGRLLRVEGERIPLYGVPQLFMAIVRSADMARTPDVRTRAILPRWACILDVTFPIPMLRDKSVMNLLAAGGIFSGVGDYRTEKGSGNYGSFRLAAADDAELLEIIATGGRGAQLAALNSPACYNDETEALLTWYTNEVQERGFRAVV